MKVQPLQCPDVELPLKFPIGRGGFVHLSEDRFLAIGTGNGLPSHRAELGRFQIAQQFKAVQKLKASAGVLIGERLIRLKARDLLRRVEKIDAAIVQERGHGPINSFQLLRGLGQPAERLERPFAGARLLLRRIESGPESTGLITHRRAPLFQCVIPVPEPLRALLLPVQPGFRLGQLLDRKSVG